MDYESYLKNLQSDCDKAYEIAGKARSMGFDPVPYVEIPQAHDLADRTQKLLDFLHPRDTANQIRALTEKFEDMMITLCTSINTFPNF